MMMVAKLFIVVNCVLLVHAALPKLKSATKTMHKLKNKVLLQQSVDASAKEFYTANTAYANGKLAILRGGANGAMIPCALTETATSFDVAGRTVNVIEFTQMQDDLHAQDPDHTAQKTAALTSALTFGAAVNGGNLPNTINAYYHNQADSVCPTLAMMVSATEMAIFLGPKVMKYEPSVAQADVMRGGWSPNGIRTMADQVYEYFTSIGKSEAEALAFLTEAQVTHEIGHVLHQMQSAAQYETLGAQMANAAAANQELCKKKVSYYASFKDQGFMNECVAEIFTGLRYGTSFSPEVKALYDASGGPQMTLTQMGVTSSAWPYPELA